MINKNAMVRVEEVMETLGIAQDTAYKLIRKLNDELEDMGYIVVSGRLPRKFWEERFYGGADALYIKNDLPGAKEVAACL